MEMKWVLPNSRMGSKASVSEQGFSLVEIVVSMLVLAGLSLTLIPALTASVVQSANNAVLASATHILSGRMDTARAQATTCQALGAFASTSVPDVASVRGITIRVSQTLGSCPTSYPGTVTFTVDVRRTDTAAVLATATTLLYVASAN